jgi:hypothetical protein
MGLQLDAWELLLPEPRGKRRFASEINPLVPPSVSRDIPVQHIQ